MRAGKKRLLFFPHKTTNKGGEVVPKAKNAKADEALALYRQGLWTCPLVRSAAGNAHINGTGKKRTLGKEAASRETTTRPGPLGTTMR